MKSIVLGLACLLVVNFCCAAVSGTAKTEATITAQVLDKDAILVEEADKDFDDNNFGLMEQKLNLLLNTKYAYVSFYYFGVINELIHGTNKEAAVNFHKCLNIIIHDPKNTYMRDQCYLALSRIEEDENTKIKYAFLADKSKYKIIRKRNARTLNLYYFEKYIKEEKDENKKLEYKKKSDQYEKEEQ